MEFGMPVIIGSNDQTEVLGISDLIFQYGCGSGYGALFGDSKTSYRDDEKNAGLRYAGSGSGDGRDHYNIGIHNSGDGCGFGYGYGYVNLNGNGKSNEVYCILKD
jgi:hypothetical protein